MEFIIGVVNTWFKITRYCISIVINLYVVGMTVLSLFSPGIRKALREYKDSKKEV